MALTQVGKVSAKAARAVRDGYAASMASVVSVFLLMCEYFIDALLEKQIIECDDANLTTTFHPKFSKQGSALPCPTNMSMV